MKNHDKKRRAILGISGASGSIYALRLAKFLLEAGAQVYCIPSRPAKKILSDETGFDSFETAIEAQLEEKSLLENLKMCDIDDFYAPPASGSFGFGAMCILPCSMNTLGKIAGSIADNLLVRAAEVALKERRKLVVCPRESPLTLSHIENMKTLFLSGAETVRRLSAIPWAAAQLQYTVMSAILSATPCVTAIFLSKNARAQEREFI